MDNNILLWTDEISEMWCLEQLYESCIWLVFARQVEKQEKKKKKTGRAKRRIQYNRRFVNVVPTFGKKKGPNANS